MWQQKGKFMPTEFHDWCPVGIYWFAQTVSDSSSKTTKLSQVSWQHRCLHFTNMQLLLTPIHWMTTCDKKGKDDCYTKFKDYNSWRASFSWDWLAKTLINQQQPHDLLWLHTACIKTAVNWKQLTKSKSSVEKQVRGPSSSLLRWDRSETVQCWVLSFSLYSLKIPLWWNQIVGRNLQIVWNDATMQNYFDFSLYRPQKLLWNKIVGRNLQTAPYC